jgi:hypothetical protein
LNSSRVPRSGPVRPRSGPVSVTKLNVPLTMPKKKHREQAARQAQWEKENADIENRWQLAPAAKAALRRQGCVLPFYDYLDSFETEFANLVAWGKAEFRTLHAVFEVAATEPNEDRSWMRLHLPADWTQIRFDFDGEVADSYVAPDKSANLRGSTIGFWDVAGHLHTVVQVLKNPECQWVHREYRYGLKIPILLHEFGHVMDYEYRINIDVAARTGDLIEAEVYANVFALDECYRRGY